ncbi:uncharacterized protein [Bemisia tabaci]|uniref:uncharacterized protein n=1 Tax=Bemisia tabaci TaxID=7038 RepID=UPI003B27EB20
MSLKALFFFALAIVAVFAAEQPAKRAIIAPAAYPYAAYGAYPYAYGAYPYAAAAPAVVPAAVPAAAAYPYAAYPYAYGYDDGSYFPGKYGPLSKSIPMSARRIKKDLEMGNGPKRGRYKNLHRHSIYHQFLSSRRSKYFSQLTNTPITTLKMSPVKIFFLFALAFVAVFAEEAEHTAQKRQIFASVAGVPAYHAAYAAAPAVAVRAAPVVLPYDDGKYFPGKYIGTGFPYESGPAFYY